jgi:hypothetical protein
MRHKNALKGLLAGVTVALMLPVLLLAAVSAVSGSWAELRAATNPHPIFTVAPGEGMPILPTGQINSPHNFNARSPLVIPAAAFKDIGRDAAGPKDNYYFTFAGGYLFPLSSEACMRAPVYLANGRFLTRFRVFAYDNSPTANFTVQLRRHSYRSTGNSFVIASVSTSGVNTSVQVLESPIFTSSYIDNQSFQYYVTVCLPAAADLRIYAVEIDSAEEGAVFLPAVLNNVVTCFAGPEQEPNNNPDQANGPLCFNANITGKPDGLPGDYFYFDWPASGSFTVRATNFDPLGQMQLYYQSTANLVAFDGDQASGIYQINHNGAAGRYFIRLVSVTNPVGTQTYTLRVNTP